MSEKIDVKTMEEFDQLGQATECHSWCCRCELCQRFIELGDLIRRAAPIKAAEGELAI